MDSRTALAAGGALAVLLAVGFCVKRDTDIKNDVRIAALDSAHVADSIARVASEHQVDSLLLIAQHASILTGRVDTLWRTRSTTILGAVHAIARDTLLADSVKILQIVAKADSLKLWGDSLSTAVRELRLSLAHIGPAVEEARVTGAKERADLLAEVALLKRRSRHWGLGATLGYGATKQGRQLVLGPQLNAGLTYRW